MKEGGGTVILTVKECKDYFEIVVSDDGVGFIPEKDYKSDGNHVGIRNVRQRLDIICQATLEVESEPGRCNLAGFSRFGDRHC